MVGYNYSRQKFKLCLLLVCVCAFFCVCAFDCVCVLLMKKHTLLLHHVSLCTFNVYIEALTIRSKVERRLEG